MNPIEDWKSERKKLLQEVEALISMIPNPVIVVNQEGSPFHANAIAESVWRYSPIVLLNKNISELINQKELIDFIKRGKPLKDYPVELKDSMGNDLDYMCRIHPLFVNKKAMGAVLLFIKFDKKLKKVKLESSVRYSFADIRGNSEAVVSLKNQAAKIANSDSTLLIRGESGTGKEVLAQAIHGSSRRKEGPFIAINCAAIPESLLESELFGYEEGSFTGAKKGGKPGRFEMAQKGTLFLDEIGDMPLFLQAKLLRVLQERCIERIGSSKSIPIDVRVIAATHKDLELLVTNRQFREDLYFRLNVIPLFLPPLRDRKDDLYELIDYFMKQYGSRLGKETKRMTSQVLKRLYDYQWPGNIRELENVIEYIVNLEIGDLITITSLPTFLKNNESPIQNRMDFPENQNENIANPDILKVKDSEDKLILKALQRYGITTEGKRMAAKSLGISMATLYRRLQRIQREKKLSN